MKVTLSNRMTILMAERKVRTATHLAKMITDHGYPISTSQTNRYLKDNPPAMTMAFIQAVCSALSCTPNELFAISIVLDKGESLDQRIKLSSNTEISYGDGNENRGNQLASPPPQQATNQPEPKAQVITPWSGTHPVAGPKMAPIPSIPKK